LAITLDLAVFSLMGRSRDAFVSEARLAAGQIAALRVKMV
jgi:hypothetical protein